MINLVSHYQYLYDLGFQYHFGITAFLFWAAIQNLPELNGETRFPVVFLDGECDDEGYIVRNGKICEPVRGAALIGNGGDVIQKIDMVGQDLDTAQGNCGASPGMVPTDVGQPLIRVSSITVGGR